MRCLALLLASAAVAGACGVPPGPVRSADRAIPPAPRADPPAPSAAPSPPAPELPPTLDDAPFAASLRETFEGAEAPVDDVSVDAATQALEHASRCQDVARTNARAQPPAATLSTRRGPLTLDQIASACAKRAEAIRAGRYEGCGSEDVTVTSYNLSGGGFTPPQVTGVDGAFSPVACAEMPRLAIVPAAFQDLDVQRVLRECDGATVLVMDDTVWTYERSKTGQVDRTATGTCYARGKLKFKLSSR